LPELVQWVAFALLAMLAGASFVMQQAVNASLRGALGSAAWAGFFSYLGGTLTMLAVIAVLREAWSPAQPVARIPWWLWSGGFFGAVYIVVAILLLPRLGAATVIALIVLGQMLASLAFDHWGAFGLPTHPVDLPRLLGAALLVAGVVLLRW
jgi:transporter family-2 protein